MFQSVKEILSWFEAGKINEATLADCLRVREIAVQRRLAKTPLLTAA